MNKVSTRTNSIVHRQEAGSISNLCADLGIELMAVNMLVAFPVSKEMVKDWASHIERTIPDIEPDRIKFIMDQFAMNRIKWDKDMGIQNVYNALKITRQLKDGRYYLCRH